MSNQNVLPNHHKDLRKKYNIRIRYRAYRSEMEAYGWCPLDFRTWWSWEQDALKKNGYDIN